MHKMVTYTRNELFAKVWSTPMLQLAKEIGVSDVAIGKACRRAGIPLPGRGYWAKDAKVRESPELPAIADGSHERISFRVLDVALISQLRPKSPAELKAQRESINVPQALRSPHPLVAGTLEASKKQNVDHGRLILGSKALDVRVSPGSIGRALRLMNTLIGASEKKGHEWAISKEGKTIITCQGESMRVVLKERIVRKERLPAPAPAPKRRVTWQPYVPSWPTIEWTPTTQLTFHVDAYISSGAQRTWQDNKRKTLEDKLSDILAGLPLIAAGIKIVREEREAWNRAYEEKERKAADHARMLEALRLARGRFVGAMQSWERASRIRLFCEAIENQLAGLPADEAQDVEKWVEWIRLQADQLDPLKKGLLNLRPWSVKVPDHFTGCSSWEKGPEDWWSDSVNG